MTISFDVYRPVVRLAVGLIVLAIINWILTNLPMVKAVSIPGSPISITAIVSVVVGFIMIALLLNFGREFSPRIQAALPTISEISPIVSSGIALSVVTVAYLMFKDATVPLMKEYGWLYPLAFLVIAIWPLVTLITALYRSSNKVADLAAVKIAEASGELVKCAKCGAYISSGAKFCPLCSAPVTRQSLVIDKIKCSFCGAENKADHVYCLVCGKALAVKVTEKTTVKVPETEESDTVKWD